MNTSLIFRFLAAVGVCLGLAQAAVAQDSLAAESVWIFSDRYISSEHKVSDPGAPNAHVPIRLRAIRLDFCEPFAAALLMTSYVFRDFHLEMHPLAAEHPACTVETPARVVRVGISQTRVAHEDTVVNQYWRGLMP